MASLFRLRTALTRTSRPCITRTSSQNVVSVVSSSFSTAQNVAPAIPSDATTAGKVLNYLNTLPKQDSPETLDNAHIQALIESCDSPGDYPKLLHAITTFKRSRNYIMDLDTANLLIDKVLSTSTPSSAEGPLWVLENFKPRTGLYYSTQVYKLDKVLNQLYNATLENEQLDNERVWKALQQVSTRLIQRKTLHCARGLKKRAKKEYLASLQTKGGPTQHTVRRIVEIGVTVKGGDADAVDETIRTFIEPFQAANVSIHPRTLEWLEQQKIESNEEQEEEGDKSEDSEQDEASEKSDETQNDEEDKKE